MILNTLLLINCIIVIDSKNAQTSKNIESEHTITEANKNIVNKATDNFYESSLEENWDKVNPLKILNQKPATMFPITTTLRKKVANKKYRIVPPVPKHAKKKRTTSILYETNLITLFPKTPKFVNSPLYFLGNPAHQYSPPVLRYSLPGYHLAPLPKEFVVVSAEKNAKYIRDLDLLTSFKDIKASTKKILKITEAKQTRRNTMKEMDADKMLDEMVKQAIGAMKIKRKFK